MNGGFDNLRPEAHADEAIRHIHALTRIAGQTLEDLLEPMNVLGVTAAYRVFIFLQVSQISASAKEIAQGLKMSPRTAGDGLKRCRERDYVEADPAHVGMWRVVARFRHNV